MLRNAIIKMRRGSGVVLLVAGAASLLFGVLVLLPTLYHNVQQETCEGRLLEGQTLRDTEPDPVSRSQVTFFPVGVLCTMVRANGARLERFYIDWEESSLIYGGVVIVAIGAGLWNYPPRKKIKFSNT